MLSLIFHIVAVDTEYTKVLILTEDILLCLKRSLPNLYTMGIQPFSWHMVTSVTGAGSQATHARITISDIPNHPNYCVIFIIHKLQMRLYAA
jgi:hypothetical protein